MKESPIVKFLDSSKQQTLVMFCLKARDFRTFAQVYDGAPWRSITPICCFVLRRGVRGEWETSKWRWNLGVYYLKVVGGMRQPYEHEKRPSQRVSVKAESKKLRFFYDPLAIRRQKFGFFFIILKNRTQPEIESVTRFWRFGSGGGLDYRRCGRSI